MNDVFRYPVNGIIYR